MDDVTRLEHLCADAWPALADEALGQWRMRAAGGFTGRANSTLTTGEPDVPGPEALRRTIDFAAAHGIPPTAHVVVGSSAEDTVARAGWRVNEAHPGGAESAVLTGSVTDLGGRAGAVPAATAVHRAPSPGWWRLAVGDTGPSPAQRHVLAGRSAVGFATCERNGRTVGAVRGAVVADLLHIARLAVSPEFRRRGLAVGLIAALAEWAGRLGARRYALQVATHNVPAVRLYTRLGGAEHHRYRYWIPRA